MTTVLRGMVVEDDPAFAASVKSILNLAFRKLDCSVSWETVALASRAVEIVQADPAFDFAIVDLGLEDGWSGLNVVEALREMETTKSYILVITGKALNYPAYLEQARSAGADYAIIRTRLEVGSSTATGTDEWDGFSLARRIRNHMIVQDRVDVLKITFEEDIGVESMLHSLGEPPADHRDARARGEHIARTLILDCLGRGDDTGTKLRVGHLAPGRSGAYICKVLRMQAGRADQSFVVKIGLDQDALKAERAANRAAADVLAPHLLVELTDDVKVDPASGYAALTARLAHDAVPLSTWLLEPTTTLAQAMGAADELFGHLSRLFQENLRQPHPTDQWLALSPVHRLRVHNAMGEYAGVWAHEEGAGLGDVEQSVNMIREFVDSAVLPGIDVRALGKEVTYIHAFGDLHATNALVQTVGQPRPVLVDASEYGPHHWATDAARLLVDLVLRVRRPGLPSMLWSTVSDDCAYAERLCHCAEGPTEAPTEPIDAFVARLVAERRSYLCLDDLEFRAVNWHWQWHVALAREFLRQGSRPGIAPVRAVVGLAAAAAHLARAGDALLEGGNRSIGA